MRQIPAAFRTFLPWATAFFAACSSPSDVGTESAPPFTGSNVGNQVGAGGAAGSSAAAIAPTTGSAGSGNDASHEGMGGSAVELAGSGGSPASVSTGGTGTTVANAGSAGQNAGGTGGAAGTAAVGRVGAELCPPGPFGSPLPDNLTPTPLVRETGDNGFHNWEGVVWINDSLYWSELDSGPTPPARIHRFTPATNTFTAAFIANTGSNGLGVDQNGNILAATHDLGRIAIYALPGGARSDFGGTSATTFNNARFDSPNDLVLRNDGNLYFTDPDFQAPNQRPQQNTRAYRISPQGEVTQIEQLSNPNGITISPDGGTLYIDSGSGSGLRRYTLDAAGAPSAGTDIQITGNSGALQTPDGMAIDCAGNLYVIENGASRIRVLSPTGVELGIIGNVAGGAQPFAQPVTNAAFGGADHKTLFISGFVSGGSAGIYSVNLNVPGLPY